MLVSLNWLKKYVELPSDSDELIRRIGAQVAEVESVTDLSAKYKGVLVAEISEAGEHPDADKLGLYQVNIGEQNVQVVAGDKTLNAGDKVAYIPPGSIVPITFNTDEPFVIEKRPLRGQESNGMMASAKELAWGENHAGVLKLDTDKPAGTTLIDAYELDDLIIEIENKTLTHRPDCFGMIGFAREVAGVNDIAFRTPDWLVNATKSQSENGDKGLSINVQADECGRYVGIIVDGVSVKPSPILLQSYLSRVSIRPINNIVDITNYLMAETGQPLHAFDYDKVNKLSDSTTSIVVRKPRAGEKLTLLDGREIEPHSDALLICTDTQPLALAGVMGGANSEVDDNTKSIIIESANFDLYNIRRTSMIHGIFSEAVTRFIRGQNAEQCLAVAQQAASMILDLAGGKAGQLVDEYPQPQELAEISISTDFINSRLGSDLTAQSMSKLLNNVELGTTVSGENLTISVPFWRKDLRINEDIVEEVGRLYGYDNLPASLPIRDLRPTKLDNKKQLINDARQILVEAGSNEVLTYNFLAQADLTRSNLDVQLAYRLRNSLSPKLQVMRTALMPSLLDKIHSNIKLGYSEFGLFEINKSHRNNLVENGLPVEEHSLAYVYAADSRVRSEKANGAAYYQVVHILNYLLDKLQIDWTELVSVDAVEDDWLAVRLPSYETKRVAAIVSDKGVLGIVGEPKQNVKKNYKLPDYVAGFELNINLLSDLSTNSSTYYPLPKFPGTQKDVTIKVNQDLSARDVMEVLASSIVQHQDMNNLVSLVDIFQNDESTKNLTFRLDLQHKNHTLTTEEANGITTQSVDAVLKIFEAEQV